MACAALVWSKSGCHARGHRFGFAVDQDFGFAEWDLGDLPVVVAFVVVVDLQAVDEMRHLFKSMAGFVRVLGLMLGQGEDDQVQRPGEPVGLFLEDHNLLDHDFSSVHPQLEANRVISRNDIVRDEWELVVPELGWRNKRLIQPNPVPIFLIDLAIHGYGTRVR